MKTIFIKIKEFISVVICDFFHIGGTIKRNNLERINWQCDTCGRWANNPVSIKDETLQVNKQISTYIHSMTSKG